MAFLSERGIKFEKRDVRDDPAAARELVGKYNSRATPTIVVDNEVMVGFDPTRLARLLSLS